MNRQRALRSASRRLRHRSRSVAVSVALGASGIAAAWVGTESVLAALGLPPLWLSPADLVALAAGGGYLTVAAGGAVGLLGLACLAIAVTPGRLRRREITDERTTWVIDDDVLAAGLSRATARAAGVGTDQVRTVVGRRRAVTRVRPSTGFRPDLEATNAAAAGVVAAVSPSPAPRTSVVIDREGVLA
ncbi:hypothetical protein [Microbacterium sp. SLBN-146]|uniref:hypothetical protein n=1 Tax=Microbacterium sp. SLBN-146 TaxID=2768457 RepID=UPI00115289CF|nr:hypothetical protein [Microbacterium sp. SLBN-146]TQJ31530.1 hypothetical protein FBY39_2007 [Microbacterium sp. SLBN-146]